MIAVIHRAGGAIRHQRWLVLGMLIFFACIQYQSMAKIQHGENGSRSAFLRWKLQLRELDEGVNVWDKYAYPNPPIMALVLYPFMQLPPLMGAMAWFMIKALMALIAILTVFTLLDRSGHCFPTWGKALAAGMCLRPFEGDLVHGNINLFILFLVVLALYAFCQRREYLAGSLLGLSIACKVTPILFIAYFLWKQSWKTLLGTIVSLIVFVLLIPAAVFGWSNNLEYLASWHQQMIAPYVAGAVTSEHQNQSLPGLLHRMLCEEASFSDYVGSQKIVLATHNMLSLDRETVHWIIIGCMALYLICAMRYCRTSTASRPSWQLLAEFSVILLGMLLFCERTWKHHCVTLLIPLSVATYGLACPSFTRGMRWYLGITLVAVFLLMFATTSGHLDAQVDEQARWGKLAQVYGAYVGVFFLLLASMLVMLAQGGAGKETNSAR